MKDYSPHEEFLHSAKPMSKSRDAAAKLFDAIADGESRAAGRLLPLVYDELRQLAAKKLAQEKAGHTLEATALVHEAYLRLVDKNGPRSYKDAAHFFAAAAVAMRRILIENARRKLAGKRGGGWQRQDLDNLPAPAADEELVALDEAMTKLAGADPVKARLVELRYFGGLTGEQAAAVLNISPTTADRHWAYARAWLQAEVRRS